MEKGEKNHHLWEISRGGTGTKRSGTGCRPSILPLNTCIYPMGVTLTHRSHMTPLGPF